MTLKRATIFGGSGFLGRQIVQRLARQGTVVRVAVRDPEAALFLKPMGAVGQIVPVPADVTRPDTVARWVEGADAVVNCVSLYVERGKTTFQKVHVDGGRNVAEAAKAAGVPKLIHVSGIGSLPDHPSKYARARAAGDKAVKEAFGDATFLNPSVMFGPGDSFFETLAEVAKLSPVMPVFGGGKSKLQPVYVGDVADAAMAAMTRADTAGKSFDLGGPKVYAYRALIEMLLEETNRHKPIVSIPFWMAGIMAFFMGVLPNPPLTRDQLKLLREDNVVPDRNGLEILGITPTAVEVILPTYMDKYRRGGRWAQPEREA